MRDTHETAFLRAIAEDDDAAKRLVLAELAGRTRG